MEKYKISSVEHSIIQPDMVDVVLEHDEHFSKCFRVSGALKNVKPHTECVMHDNMVGVPVAYCFGNEMHLVNAPETRHDARRQIAMIMGLMQGSLNRFHFYMAMRAALKTYGVRPSWGAVTNMMRLGALQNNTKER